MSKLSANDKADSKRSGKEGDESSAPVVAARKIAANENISSGIITSGAGHDTAQFANTGTPSVIVFIKQDDPISHNPRESRSDSSFRDACKIISGMVMNPSTPVVSSERNVTGDAKKFAEYITNQGEKPYQSRLWRS